MTPQDCETCPFVGSERCDCGCPFARHNETIVKLQADNAKLSLENKLIRTGNDQLSNQVHRLRKALKIYSFYRPLRPTRGSGQADGTLSCGHVGQLGAPCCWNCAKKIISEATQALNQEGVDEKHL